MANYHTVPNPKGGWDVEREKSKRATKHFDRQNEAYDYTRQLAKKQKGEALLHGRNGRIRARESFGNDPNPPADKEH